MLRCKSCGEILADPGTEQRHPWARGRAALRTAWSGVWSVVGDLYSQIGRTLSTNWNLKFQRGKQKKRARRDLCMCGDDYTGDVPLGLLFFVLQLSFVLPQQLAWPNGGGLSRGPDLAWGFPALERFQS